GRCAVGVRGHGLKAEELLTFGCSSERIGVTGKELDPEIRTWRAIERANKVRQSIGQRRGGHNGNVLEVVWIIGRAVTSRVVKGDAVVCRVQEPIGKIDA